jgi:DNA-directed RNA polymerase subunit RPC12/RpoP
MEEQVVQHRAQLGVECPQCHWRHFVEVNLDGALADGSCGREIQAAIQEWLRSRCPDHLWTFLELSKN